MALKFQIQAGVLGIPVKVDAAARPERVSLNMVYDGAGVSQVYRSKKTGKEISRSDTKKGFETASGKFVVLEDAELKALVPRSERTVVLDEFVPADSIDPLYFESSWYIAPEPAGTKSYALLFNALKTTGKMGLGKFTAYGREQVGVVRAARNGLVLHSLYYESEVRSTREFRPDLSATTEKERKISADYIEAMSVPTFDPSKFSDTYKASLEALIARKNSDHIENSAVPSAPVVAAPDIMVLMERTLQLLGKGPRPVEKHTSPVNAGSLLDEIVEAAA